MQKDLRKRRSAFTLIELLVVVAIIALLISILLPTLSRAKQQTRALKCLGNLRSLGQGVMVYVTEWRRLPGPLHPAVYRNQGLKALMEDPVRPMSYENAVWTQERFLTWKLRGAFSDSTTFKDSVTDQISTCPVSAGINPDSNFVSFYNTTGRYVYPTHYVLNNVGLNGEDGGALGNMRTTDPAQYFGFSSYSRNDPNLLALERKYPPQPISKVDRPAEEWMIADAWYRKRPNAAFPELQQEGPYQWDWTGESLPNFAPHFAKRTYRFSSSSDRNSESSTIRNGKQDGQTNTVYFDGHARPVNSKTLTTSNGFELLYGFEGTINPQTPLPPSAWK